MNNYIGNMMVPFFTDPSFSADLLTHAKQLFKFAEQYPGKYSDSIADAAGYYRYMEPLTVYM